MSERLRKVGLPIALATTLFVGGSASQSGEVVNTSAPTMSPSAARLALTHGISCTAFGAEGPGYSFYNPNLAQEEKTVEVGIRVSTTRAFNEAWSEYTKDTAVRWSQLGLDVQTLPKGTRRVTVGTPTFNIPEGNEQPNTVDALLEAAVPAIQANEGDEFAISVDENVDTGKTSRHDWTRTIGEATCGVLDQKQGYWHFDPAVAVQSAILSYNSPNQVPAAFKTDW
jgi:hypothetical protein